MGFFFQSLQYRFLWPVGTNRTSLSISWSQSFLAECQSISGGLLRHSSGYTIISEYLYQSYRVLSYTAQDYYSVDLTMLVLDKSWGNPSSHITKSDSSLHGYRSQSSMSTSSMAMLELSSGLMSKSLSSWLLLWENSNFPGVGKAGKSSETPAT